MSRADVSIVIPCLNRAALLREALESVRAQTYQNWEAVVVDDGSTDQSVFLVQKMAREDLRIRIIRREGLRSGAPACRNQGLAASKGEYVIFLDSDDALAPHCLYQRVAAMRAEPCLDFAVFPCQIFRQVPSDTDVFWNAHTAEDDLDRFLKLDVPWQTASPIWTRRALGVVGPWDEQVLSWQDWEFHLRALIAGLRYRKFDRADCYWRVTDKSRDSIGRRSSQPEHIRSQEYMLGAMARRLLSVGLLTDRRRDLLAGLYLLVARNWLQPPPRFWDALETWHECRRHGLIDLGAYARGSLYLLCRSGRLKRLMEQRAAQDWLGVTIPPPFNPSDRDIRTASLVHGP